MKDIRGCSTYMDSKRKSFQFYSITGARIDHRLFDATYSGGGRYERIDFKDVGSQYERRRGDFVSKTNRVNYFTNAKQVYRYQGDRNLEEVGVGSVKALPRKRVKKIYLPETDNKGVECTDLSAHFRGEQKNESGYYEHKRKSSKCVGGVVEPTKEVLNEKLSPIIKTESGTTSPKILANNKAESNVSQINTVSNTQGNKELEKVENDKYSAIESKSSKKTENNLFMKISNKTTPDPIVIQNNQAIHSKAGINVNKISSVSFLQHVHNLEIASNENIGCSRENNMEIEYNNKCSSKIDEHVLAERKPMPEFKSNSFLRRRFEALRRGLGKKKDLKNNSVLISRTASCASHKDVSIASDPPSLEGHSYSNIKVYSPIHDFSVSKYKTNLNPSLGDKEGTECQSVRNMFKLWGTMFNFDEDPSKKNKTDFEVPKHDSNDSKLVNPEKKTGKKFSFFRKKSKNKTVTDRPKKGVTTGRCEVKDGLTIKLDKKVMKPVQEITEAMPEQVLEDYVDKLRRAWLQKFLFTNNDSRSVKIRWDNKTYATSSSTIFELMDDVFKETGVVFRSRSDTTFTEESSYRTIRKPRVNFLRDVEAWMVPNTMTNLKVPVHRKAKEIADTKQNTHFPRNIELVLHSKDFVRINHNSSDCLKINIPKGCFSDSEGRPTSSDEKVYNVVEYETTNSGVARKIIKQRGYNKEIQTDYVIDSFGKITDKPPVHRDVMLQGSEVHVAKRCDVIGVGIITQRDLGKIKNATIKIQDEFTDDYESDENLQLKEKKCEFAESYMHDYYRQWTPLGIDLFSWCVSDSHVRGSAENLSNSIVYYQDDGSKSCSNICDDFQTSVIVTSCNTSSCSRCHEPESQKPEENASSKFFKRFKKGSKSASLKEEVRVLPKDSKEVFKSRQLYAKSNRSQWLCPDEKSCSFTSKESKGAQEDSSKFKRIRYQPGTKGIEKVCEKEQEKKDFGGILSHRGSAACETGKKETVCPNDEKVLPETTYIVPPPCKSDNDVEKNLKSPMCVPSTPVKSNIFPKQSLQEPPPQFPRLRPQQSPCQSPRQSPCQSPCQSPRQSPCQSPRQSPQRSPCQSPQLKRSLLTKNDPNTTLGSAPTPKCLPKFPNMSPSTSPKSKIPIKRQTSPRQLGSLPLNAPKSSNKECPPSYSGSRVSLKTPSLRVCSKCKNPDCGKVTPKEIVTKRSSNSSHCPCVVRANKSKQILEKKDSPTKNRLKPCPTPPLTKIPIPPEKAIPPRSKIGGIFVKLKPSKKKSGGSKECSAQGSNSNVIRLNSKEKITIRMKPYTPSTEEIRDGYDIKVKDEDGITLYERKQYRSNQPNLCALNDVFKDSNIRRVSTHSPVNSVDKVLDKSDLSVSNLVEIQFNLKVTQGDKMTEINIGKDDDTQKKTEEKRQVKRSACDVYALTENDKDNDKYVAEDDIPKNDINIRIIIKNFKPKVENKCDIVGNDHNYYRNITEKFQTVSTAYSPIELNQNADSRVLSVHRATIDLSVDESKSKLSQAIVSEGLTDNDLCTVSTFSVTRKYDDEQSFSKMKNDDTFLESIPSGTDSTAKLTEELKLKFNFEIKDNDSVTDTDEPAVTMKIYDNESLALNSTENMSKYRSRADRKDLLKMVMEEASLLKNSKDKAKIRKLKNILKSILTSDSEPDEIAVASNELIRDLIQNFLSKKDSTGNYYSMGGYKVNQLYPSKESSTTDNVSSKEAIPCEGCLCSKFARKLNLCGNGNEGACCCRNPQIRSKTVSCDLMSEEITNANEEISIVEPEFPQTVHTKTMSALSLRKSAQLDSEKSISGLERTFVSRENRMRECDINRMNGSTLLSVKNDDLAVVASKEANRAQSNQTVASKMSQFGRSLRKSRVANYVTSSNILQSYDVKRAVLKIYAEKTVTSDGEQLVARLPKFVYDRENELKNYEEICESSYKNVCKGNLVMMSVRR